MSTTDMKRIALAGTLATFLAGSAWAVTMISGPDWSQNNRAGDILDFAAGNPHEFEALEPATRIVNIIKGLRA